jgi:hypothetical protein
LGWRQIRLARSIRMEHVDGDFEFHDFPPRPAGPDSAAGVRDPENRSSFSIQCATTTTGVFVVVIADRADQFDLQAFMKAWSSPTYCMTIPASHLGFAIVDLLVALILAFALPGSAFPLRGVRSSSPLSRPSLGDGRQGVVIERAPRRVWKTPSCCLPLVLRSWFSWDPRRAAACEVKAIQLLRSSPPEEAPRKGR